MKPGPFPSAHDIRTLHCSLTTADDEQLTRVVAVIDGMAQRDEADKLIAPLRPRLAQLRPPRQLTFCRLLFVPLDPVIVPPVGWRRGTAAIPRSTLMPLAAQVWGALGADQARVFKAIEGRLTDDPAAIAVAGAIVWPRAAKLLSSLPMPDGWTGGTGLNAGDHAAVSRSVAMVLRVAQEIQAMVDAAVTGQQIETNAIVAALEAGEGQTHDGMALLLSVLLQRLPPRRMRSGSPASSRKLKRTLPQGVPSTAPLTACSRVWTRPA